MRLLRYLQSLSLGKTVLWCYLIWWVCTVVTCFDPAPSIWLNSVGISVIVGVALLLSVGGRATPSWQTFRLFFMPFAVSSFAALIKGHGFVLVFPPSLAQAGLQLGACGVFLVLVWMLKRLAPATPG